jgi:hypothetical protein
VSPYINLTGNAPGQRPQEHRAAGLICVSRYTSTARGPPVAPPLASSLHPGFHCRWCLLALYCGRPGASEAGEDVVATAGCGGLLLGGRGEAILTMVAT